MLELPTIFGRITGTIGSRSVVAMAALMVLLASAGGCWPGSASADTDGGTAEARVGELIVTVTDNGTLRAAESVDIINRVEGSASVLWLVDEGSHVQAGDELVRLDPTELQERLIKEESELRNQEASAAAATADLEITLNRALSDVNKAELAVRFAEMDLRKYTEGDLPQQRRKAEAAIIIAEEELQRALDRLNGTTRLESEGIVSRQELEADTFAVKKAEINLAEAKQSLVLLDEFESKKQLALLDSNHTEAKRELDRVKQKTTSEIAQAEATNAARQANLTIQRQRYQRVLDQLEHTVIRAPQAGIIVYWVPTRRWGDQRPVEVGSQVRFRQNLMMLPDVSKMVVDAKVHESQVDRVREGMPATIRVDAFPDRVYLGKVEKISVMADSGNWLTPDVKEYKTIVSIDPDQNMEGLKPNMNARVEIIAAHLKDQLLVPVTGVHTLRGRPAALVQNGEGLEVREVKVGATNDSMIVIEEGLAAGERVLIYRPEVLPEIPWKADDEEENGAGDEGVEALPAVPQISPVSAPSGADGGEETATRRRRPEGAAVEGGGAGRERPAGGRRPREGAAGGGEGRVRPGGAGAGAGDGGAGGGGGATSGGAGASAAGAAEGQAE